MLRLAEALREARIPQCRLARAAGLSERAMHRLLRAGEWPKRQRPEAVRERVLRALEALGLTAAQAANGLDGLLETVTAPRENAAPSGATPTLENHMLITKRSLSKAAREAFGLPPTALMAPVRAEEVFLGGEMRVGFEHLLAKARFGGLLALAGESGAGKTTLKDLLVTTLCGNGRDLVVIEPHTQAMEANDRAGKTLKAAAIMEAILRAVAPTERLRLSSEARLAQVEAALARSADEDPDRRHLLVIDEAHCLPIPTLKHLKRFWEFKRQGRGLQPHLLSIVLLGQPELKLRLSTYDQEVREVWQRCELATLRPLERELAAYLKHRLGAAAEAFEASAIDALRAVLTEGPRSMAYPLAIDNWTAEILNVATKVGARRITAETVAAAKKQIAKTTEDL